MFAYTQEKKQVEQTYFQQVVDGMTAQKACCVSLCCRLFKGEMGGHEIIEYQANAIAKRVGDGGIDNLQSQQIGCIVQSC